MIPKIIHQVWIGPKNPPLKQMETWKQKHPDFQYIFWDETTIQKHFPNGLDNQKQFNLIPEYAGKCDILRYEILYHFGGFYADADSICIRKLDDHLFENDSFASYENEFRRGRLVGNSFIGATKNNELMKLLIREIKNISLEQIAEDNAWRVVGPLFFTKTIFDYEYTPISIYPSWFFYPQHHLDITYAGKGKPYADHFWMSQREQEML